MRAPFSSDRARSGPATVGPEPDHHDAPSPSPPTYSHLPPRAQCPLAQLCAPFQHCSPLVRCTQVSLLLHSPLRQSVAV